MNIIKESAKSLGKSVKSTISGLFNNSDAKNNEIKVNDVKIINHFVFDSVDEGSTIKLKENASIELKITRKANSLGKSPKKATLHIAFKKGFKTDGASVPKKFRGIMPTYIAKDDECAHIYNAAAFVHDGLYAYKGVIKEYMIPSDEENKPYHTLERNECDDILEGLWKKSGFVNNVVASLGKLAVFLVAGGPDHWGHEDENMQLFSATISYDN